MAMILSAGGKATVTALVRGLKRQGAGGSGAGHWQGAVLPVATQSWPFMQVVSLPLLKKQPSMSFEQVPTVPAVGQKVPSAVQPRAPLLQVQSPVGRLPVHIWRLPQVLLLA